MLQTNTECTVSTLFYGNFIVNKLSPVSSIIRFNLAVITSVFSTVLTYGLWLTCQKPAGIIAYAILYGIFGSMATSKYLYYNYNVVNQVTCSYLIPPHLYVLFRNLGTGTGWNPHGTD